LAPRAFHFDRVEKLVEQARAAKTVLVKGSRFMKMERVVAALTGGHGGSALMLLELASG